jgi:hypothetical protein
MTQQHTNLEQSKYWFAAVVGFLLIFNGLFGSHLTTQFMRRSRKAETPPTLMDRVLYIALFVGVCLYGLIHLIR